MSRLVHKTSPMLHAKTLTAGAGTLRGTFEAVWAVYGNEDSDADIVEPGAFLESWAAKMPKVVWSHSWLEVPIGVTLEVDEFDRVQLADLLPGGVPPDITGAAWAKARLAVDLENGEDNQRAREVYSALKMVGGDGRPAIDEFSWGGKVTSEYTEKRADGSTVSHIERVAQTEWGPCLKGANPSTALLGSKSHAPFDVDRVLRIANGDEDPAGATDGDRLMARKLRQAHVITSEDARELIGKFETTRDRAGQFARVQSAVVPDNPDGPPNLADVIGMLDPPKVDTKSIHSSGGKYKAYRKPLHDSIVAKAIGTAEPVSGRAPRITYLAGGPGSGKTTTLERMLAESPDLARAAMVDPDGIKTQIPEYREMAGAGDSRAAIGTHEESSDISKRVQFEAYERKLDVLTDGTGDSERGKFLRRIKEARAAGYTPEVVIVTIPTDVALERVEERFKRTNRTLPDDVVRDTHRLSSENAIDVIGAGHEVVPTIRIFDNNVPEGASPRLIWERRDGLDNVYDTNLFEAFLAKATPPQKEKSMTPEVAEMLLVHATEDGEGTHNPLEQPGRPPAQPQPTIPADNPETNPPESPVQPQPHPPTPEQRSELLDLIFA